MIVPNKVTPYKKSILSKLPLVLTILKQEKKKPKILWDNIKEDFEDINEYLLTLAVAFALGTIEYLNDEQEIKYVKANNM